MGPVKLVLLSTSYLSNSSNPLVLLDSCDRVVPVLGVVWKGPVGSQNHSLDIVVVVVITAPLDLQGQ